MNEPETTRLRAAITLERDRVVEQIANLQTNLGGIVEAVELTSNDDEHDPEGTTIAYERAQVTALLSQAEHDLAALDATSQRLDDGTAETCEVCGGPIAIERLMALPGVRTCIGCAS
ncbi:MAG: TraR/DksA C4-type zinc finger protein [Ilumatobacteraceae bacterium]